MEMKNPEKFRKNIDGVWYYNRIDSTKGYTKDNTQLVCDIVNRMKLDLPMNEFVTLCKIIYDEQNRT